MMKYFTEKQNQEINKKLDMAFNIYGIEYNDFQFNSLLTFDEVCILIEDRIKEIKETLEESYEIKALEKAIKDIENGKGLRLTQKKLFIDNNWIWTEEIVKYYTYEVKTNLESFTKDSQENLIKAYKTGWKSLFIDNLKAAIRKNK